MVLETRVQWLILINRGGNGPWDQGAKTHLNLPVRTSAFDAYRWGWMRACLQVYPLNSTSITSPWCALVTNWKCSTCILCPFIFMFLSTCILCPFPRVFYVLCQTEAAAVASSAHTRSGPAITVQLCMCNSCLWLLHLLLLHFCELVGMLCSQVSSKAQWGWVQSAPKQKVEQHEWDAGGKSWSTSLSVLVSSLCSVPRPLFSVDERGVAWMTPGRRSSRVYWFSSHSLSGFRLGGLTLPWP
jgi:hypothetical protein